MSRVKEIEIRVIPPSVANPFVRQHHYSGKVVANSRLHFGAFLDGRLHGVLSYGSSMDKRKTIQLVKGTGWNEFLELNRMAFDDYLPRNSESYCIGKTLRMIHQQAPHIKWVISFADGTQCGDGTIYRASNFVLTGINPNKTIIEMPDGSRVSDLTLNTQGLSREKMRYYDRLCGLDESKPHKTSDYLKGGARHLQGFQLRYVYFLDKHSRKNLTVPELPYSAIDAAGAGMYKGETTTRESRHQNKSEAQIERETRKAEGNASAQPEAEANE